MNYDGNILFSGPMVVAILEGRKTQTRRLASSPLAKRKPGQKLWVREKTRVDRLENGMVWGTYLANDQPTGGIIVPPHLKPLEPGKCMSMGCFYGAHRIGLLLTKVWIEPLQDISIEDAMAEGLKERPDGFLEVDEWVSMDPKGLYRTLWNSLHRKKGERWDDNPDVVALEFERIA